MNPAHLHLLINHFPVVGLFLGSLLLLVGVILKNSTLKKTSYFMLIFIGFTAILANATGERAEDVVEKHIELSNLNTNNFDAVKITSDKLKATHEHIENHEHDAKGLMQFVIGLILLSSLSLLLEFKKKSMAKSASFIVLVISAFALYFAVQAGNSGGKINHPEIEHQAD